MLLSAGSANLRCMELIQIGEPKQKTVIQLILEMSAMQHAEIERLKSSALLQASATRQVRRAFRGQRRKGSVSLPR